MDVHDVNKESTVTRAANRQGFSGGSMIGFLLS
jgi:hypothetical protein